MTDEDGTEAGAEAGTESGQASGSEAGTPAETEFVFDDGVEREDRPRRDAESDGGDPTTSAGPPSTGAASAAGADRAVGPTPGVAPHEVVTALLDALERTSIDVAHARGEDGVPGIVRTLFDTAAPAFRTAYGDLDGFAATLLGPIYDRLLEAETIERGPGERTGDRYVQSVLARHPDGDRTYEVVLERQRGGKYDDCWMTSQLDLLYDGESPSFRRTPTVRFGDREITCEVGDQLRAVLLSAEGYSPHNDVTQVANCGGNGLCGTCAVEVDGDVSEMAPREERRLNLPPHETERGLRLSCQTTVEGDVTVRKHDGYWGQHVAATDADADDPEATDAADADPASTGAATDAPGGSGSAADHGAISVTAAEYAGDYDYAASAGGEER